MSVYSMTGYGSAHGGAAPETDRGPENGALAVTAEWRSVNGRFLDLSLRLPEDLRSLEPALREMAGARLRRGKVELRITSARDAGAGWPRPGADALNRLVQLESMVQAWLPRAAPLSVHEALQWCRSGTPPERLDEPALAAARAALDAMVNARAREGERLADVLRERTAYLRTLVAEAAPLIPAVVQRQQQRFLERWREALDSAGTSAAAVPAEALQERALTEAAAFAIRVDVAEELSRLTAHLDEIDRLLARGGELGKRLDFLIQELHREANTLGSKSAALELTNVSVAMKVAIEQMREQVQNIE
jgi:uncharacterized protein (TIGR00255 family)